MAFVETFFFISKYLILICETDTESSVGDISRWRLDSVHVILFPDLLLRLALQISPVGYPLLACEVE